MREEALSALLALGFQKIPAQKALNKLLKERTDLKTVEALIKAALKEMSL
jgi:Holliday junction DNA helicase RuvA